MMHCWWQCGAIEVSFMGGVNNSTRGVVYGDGVICWLLLQTGVLLKKNVLCSLSLQWHKMVCLQVGGPVSGGLAVSKMAE